MAFCVKGSENMSILSIIVPVYNTEKYLKQCIDSIISQSYTDMEIILVDDGSTDGAGNICDEYQRIDNRIKVIHQENKGLISARYTGVQNAEGKYIGFVDSDDWIAADMYERLMTVAEAEQCAIVSMGYTAVIGERLQEEDDATLFGIYEKGKNLDTLLSNMMYDVRKQKRGIHPSLCCKVIDKELLWESIVKVDKNISLGEDAAVFYPCCLNAERICILRQYKYYYRIHDSSMCRSFNLDMFGKIKRFDQYMKECFRETGNKYNLAEQLKMYVWSFINDALKGIFGFYAIIYLAAIFPRNVVEKGSNIILYGAGAVGQSYYRQILESNYCNIIAWADKDGKNGVEDIINPTQIIDKEFSKLVIAVKSKLVAEEIQGELIDLGIPKEKIVWAEPQNPPQVSLRMV